MRITKRQMEQFTIFRRIIILITMPLLSSLYCVFLFRGGGDINNVAEHKLHNRHGSINRNFESNCSSGIKLFNFVRKLDPH